jgi:hypothetical protein
MPIKRAMIKYIHLKEGLNPNFNLHKLEDYEYKRTIFCHNSFDHLVATVQDLCPEGFKCVQPLALHHEIIWCMNSEREQLYRPIDRTDYCAINWAKHPVTPICVEIMRREEQYDVSRGLAPLQARPGYECPWYSPLHPTEARLLR